MPVSVSLLATDKYDILLNLAQLLLATGGHVLKNPKQQGETTKTKRLKPPNRSKRNGRRPSKQAKPITINEGQPQNTESGNHNLEPESGNRSLELLILRMTTEITHFSNVQSINIGKKYYVVVYFLCFTSTTNCFCKKT